jgi:hypothetical protein
MNGFIPGLVGVDSDWTLLGSLAINNLGHRKKKCCVFQYKGNVSLEKDEMSLNKDDLFVLHPDAA